MSIQEDLLRNYEGTCIGEIRALRPIPAVLTEAVEDGSSISSKTTVPGIYLVLSHTDPDVQDAHLLKEFTNMFSVLATGSVKQVIFLQREGSWEGAIRDHPIYMTLNKMYQLSRFDTQYFEEHEITTFWAMRTTTGTDFPNLKDWPRYRQLATKHHHNTKTASAHARYSEVLRKLPEAHLRGTSVQLSTDPKIIPAELRVPYGGDMGDPRSGPYGKDDSITAVLNLCKTCGNPQGTCEEHVRYYDISRMSADEDVRTSTWKPVIFKTYSGPKAPYEKGTIGSSWLTAIVNVVCWTTWAQEFYDNGETVLPLLPLHTKVRPAVPSMPPMHLYEDIACACCRKVVDSNPRVKIVKATLNEHGDGFKKAKGEEIKEEKARAKKVKGKPKWTIQTAIRITIDVRGSPRKSDTPRSTQTYFVTATMFRVIAEEHRKFDPYLYDILGLDMDRFVTSMVPIMPASDHKDVRLDDNATTSIKTRSTDMVKVTTHVETEGALRNLVTGTNSYAAISNKKGLFENALVVGIGARLTMTNVGTHPGIIVIPTEVDHPVREPYTTRARYNYLLDNELVKGVVDSNGVTHWFAEKREYIENYVNVDELVVLEHSSRLTYNSKVFEKLPNKPTGRVKTRRVAPEGIRRISVRTIIRVPQDGDVCIITRHPILDIGGIIVGRVRIDPNRITVGVCPSDAAALDGDYDGDEIGLVVVESLDGQEDLMSTMGVAESNMFSTHVGSRVWSVHQDPIVSFYLLSLMSLGRSLLPKRLAKVLVPFGVKPEAAFPDIWTSMSFEERALYVGADPEDFEDTAEDFEEAAAEFPGVWKGLNREQKTVAAIPVGTERVYITVPPYFYTNSPNRVLTHSVHEEGRQVGPQYSIDVTRFVRRIPADSVHYAEIAQAHQDKAKQTMKERLTGARYVAVSDMLRMLFPKKLQIIRGIYNVQAETAALRVITKKDMKGYMAQVIHDHSGPKAYLDWIARTAEILNAIQTYNTEMTWISPYSGIPAPSDSMDLRKYTKEFPAVDPGVQAYIEFEHSRLTNPDGPTHYRFAMQFLRLAEWAKTDLSGFSPGEIKIVYERIVNTFSMLPDERLDPLVNFVACGARGNFTELKRRMDGHGPFVHSYAGIVTPTATPKRDWLINFGPKRPVISGFIPDSFGLGMELRSFMMNCIIAISALLMTPVAIRSSGANGKDSAVANNGTYITPPGIAVTPGSTIGLV